MARNGFLTREIKLLEQKSCLRILHFYFRVCFEGHPDKVCDRISDAVLDAFIALEPEARVACETFATTNRVVVGGEVGLSDKNLLSNQMDQIDKIVRACIKDIGYEQKKFHHETVEITNLLHEQSAHIAQGVNADGDKEEEQAIRV